MTEVPGHGQDVARRLAEPGSGRVPEGVIPSVGDLSTSAHGLEDPLDPPNRDVKHLAVRPPGDQRIRCGIGPAFLRFDSEGFADSGRPRLRPICFVQQGLEGTEPIDQLTRRLWSHPMAKPVLAVWLLLPCGMA